MINIKTAKPGDRVAVHEATTAAIHSGKYGRITKIVAKSKDYAVVKMEKDSISYEISAVWLEPVEAGAK